MAAGGPCSAARRSHLLGGPCRQHAAHVSWAALLGSRPLTSSGRPCSAARRSHLLGPARQHAGHISWAAQLCRRLAATELLDADGMPRTTGTGSKRVPSEPVRGPRGCSSREPTRQHAIVLLLSLRVRRNGRGTPSSMSHRSLRHPLQPLTGPWSRATQVESAPPHRLREVNRASAAGPTRAPAEPRRLPMSDATARAGHARFSSGLPRRPESPTVAPPLAHRSRLLGGPSSQLHHRSRAVGY